MLTHTMPSKVTSLVPPIRVNRSSIWQWSNCCNDRLAPCITASVHPRMRDRQWKAVNNYPKLPRPGKGNVQLTLAKVRQNSSSAPSLSANDVQDHGRRSPWKNRGNRHPELVHTRFSQRYSGDDEESGHFNGKQIDTPPCLLTVRSAKKVPILGNFGTISGLELLENEWVDRQGFLAESCVSA